MAKYEVMSITSIPPAVKVEADYFVIEAGHLIFRRTRYGNTYPITVLALASGNWTQVVRLPDELPCGST